MKKLITIMLICAASCTYLFAQNPLSFKQVISKDGLTSDELYSLARSWASVTFSSAKDATQMAEDNHIIIKAYFNAENTQLNFATYSNNSVKYTLEIEVRDGRYRMTMHSFYLTSRINKQPNETEGLLYESEAEYVYPAYTIEKQNQSILADVTRQVAELFNVMSESLSSYIDQKESEEDW